MYIYSEKTNKKYDGVEACIEAEKAYDEQLEKEKAKNERLAFERAVRAKEVEDAYQKIVDVRKEFESILDKFVADYGSFYFAVRSGDMSPFSILDWFLD